MLSSPACQQAIKGDPVPFGGDGVMLRQGENGRDSNAVIKICRFNALKHCEINPVGKHRCGKNELWKASEGWQWTGESFCVYNYFRNKSVIFPLRVK